MTMAWQDLLTDEVLPDEVLTEPSAAGSPSFLPTREPPPPRLQQPGARAPSGAAWGAAAAPSAAPATTLSGKRRRCSIAAGPRKGRWTAPEDAALRAAVDRFLAADTHPFWGNVASAVPSRSAKQCRERWCEQLDPALDHGPWDACELQRLEELGRVGLRPNAIARLMGRSQNAVRNQLVVLAKSTTRQSRETFDGFLDLLDGVEEERDCRLAPLPCLFDLASLEVLLTR